MADIKDIIIELRKKRKLSQGELAEKLGISPSSVGMIEQGRRKPSFELLNTIANFFEVDTDYLMGRTNSKKSQPQQSELCFIDSTKIKMIPLFESVSAGFGGYSDYALDYIPIVANNENGNYVAIKVTGDSMETAIMDKSTVVINRDLPIYNNNVGVFKLNDCYYLKQKIIKDNEIILHSFNEFYKDIKINENDDFMELGRVVQIITEF